MVKNLHIKLLIFSFYFAAAFILSFIFPDQNENNYLLFIIYIAAANIYFMNNLDFILAFRKFSIFYYKKTILIFVLLTAAFIISYFIVSSSLFLLLSLFVSIFPAYIYTLYCMYKTVKTGEKSNENISIEKVLFEYIQLFLIIFAVFVLNGVLLIVFLMLDMQSISFALFFIILNISSLYFYSIYLKSHKADIKGNKFENHWHIKVLEVFIFTAYIILQLLLSIIFIVFTLILLAPYILFKYGW